MTTLRWRITRATITTATLTGLIIFTVAGAITGQQIAPSTTVVAGVMALSAAVAIWFELFDKPFAPLGHGK